MNPNELAPQHAAMLKTVGARVRTARESAGVSRREFSEKSGVSERFLAQLEVGKGNISLVRLAHVAQALGTTPAALLEGTTGAHHRVIALLGVRGAGKSTVGAKLAAQRGLPFLEIDARIEEVAGLSLGEIFEMHGEEYYRRVESEVLRDVIAAQTPSVIATGGSIVSHSENFRLLQSSACTIWLRASAHDHWNRVIEQGDERPMAANPHAFAELKALLSARESLYAEANYVVDTSGKSVDQVIEEVRDAVAALG